MFKRRDLGWIVWGMLLLLAVNIALMAYFARQYFSVISLATFQELLAQTGIWAPAVYIGFLMAAIIFPPLPNLTLVAGLMFGFKPAVVYSVLAYFLGSTTNFFIGRSLGRPFLERFLKKEDLAKTDHWLKYINFRTLFFLRLLPGTPFDILSYAAGLSDISLVSFILATNLGVFPHLVYSVSLGKSLTFHPIVAGTAFFIFVPAMILFHKSRRIRDGLEKYILKIN